MGALPTPAALWPADFYHSKHVELVKKLAEKTRAKKISWKASKTGYSAVVFDKLEISFVRPARGASLLSGSPWALFVVRDDQGNEILKVSNIPGTDVAPDVLRESISHLNQAVENSLAEEIDKAIAVIDRI